MLQSLAFLLNGKWDNTPKKRNIQKISLSQLFIFLNKVTFGVLDNVCILMGITQCISAVQGGRSSPCVFNIASFFPP